MTTRAQHGYIKKHVHGAFHLMASRVIIVKTFVTLIPQYWIEIPQLFWYMSGDQIGLYRMFVSLLMVAKEEAAEDEGKGDPEPQTEEGQHSREGYLGTQQR